jgi:drug/metabolite transporter (DMT)-like permease
MKLSAVIACLLWSTAFASIKTGLVYWKPFGFAGIRFVIAGLLLLPFGIKHITQLKDIQNLKTIGYVSLFQTIILYSLFYMGISRASGATSAIVIGSSPLISAITAHFMLSDDKMSVKKSLSISIGIIGIIILAISAKPFTTKGAVEAVGILILLCGTVSSSMGNIFVVKNKNSLNPVLLTSVQLFAGGAVLLITGILTEGIPDFNVPMHIFANLLWLAIISAVGFSIWFHLLQLPGIKVSTLNIYKFIIPVFGALLSWIIIPEESPTIGSVTGMILIASSVVFSSKLH